MKYLIINADDFGLHEQINKGIIKGFKEGIITSTSIMPTTPAFEEAVELAKANPDLGIGIHLTLCTCVPSCLPKNKVSTLLGSDGNFLPSYVNFAKRYYTGGVKSSELEAELSPFTVANQLSPQLMRELKVICPQAQSVTSAIGTTAQGDSILTHSVFVVTLDATLNKEAQQKLTDWLRERTNHHDAMIVFN